MDALSLNSKFVIERNLFPAFLTTKIDYPSPADSFAFHRPWEAPKYGFRTSLILISRVNLVGLNVLPWK